MADETKVTVDAEAEFTSEPAGKPEAEAADAQEARAEAEAETAAEELKENKAAEKTETPEKKEKTKKEKKPRKPFFFDTAKTVGGLIGRIALILVHTTAIAYLVMILFGALELLINSNPGTFSFCYPFTTAAMHGVIGAGVAFLYGIARIICVIVCFAKRRKG